jgi:hypothetical protein
MLSRAGLRLPARPAAPCRLFTGASEPHAAHRLLQSCSPASTRLRTSKPGELVLAKRPPTSSPSLGREEPADLCRSQGSPGDASPYRLPARRPLVARIYPSSTKSRTPSCRDANTGGDWKGSPAATCGRGTSLAGGLARLGSARPRPGHDLLGRGLPLGPLPFVPREWRESRLHPGCLPPIPSSRRCARGASWSEGRRLGRRVSPDRRSLPARHLFHRSVLGPDWVQGAFGSTLAVSPGFAGCRIFQVRRRVPRRRSDAEFLLRKGRSAWGVSAFGRSEG